MSVEVFGFAEDSWSALCGIAYVDGMSGFSQDLLTINHRLLPNDIGLHAALRRANADFPNKHVVLARNPRALLDSRFLDAVVRFVETVGDDWSLAAGGGLGLNGERYVAHYSAQDPILQFTPESRFILDALPDVVVLNANALASWLNRGLTFDIGFEPAFIHHNLLSGRLGYFFADLGCPINAPLMRRDDGKIRGEMEANAERQSFTHLRSLIGDLEPPRRRLTSLDAQRPLLDPDEVLERALKPHLEPVTLTVVVRTIFQRRHLLDRLLASILRALAPSFAVEVLLSTDIDLARAEEAFAYTKKRFSTLSMQLVTHDRAQSANMASRVRNLLLGVKAARGDYVWIMDDDDYIDPMAFTILAKQFYHGVRPIFFAAAGIHEETWETLESGRAVLAATRQTGSWAAENWRTLFEGVNRVPVCGVIAPRARLDEALGSMPMRHNLSEDYAMHLSLLLAKDLPPIVELPVMLSHISMRVTQDSTMNLTDRSSWCRDIFGFLHDLKSSRKVDRTAMRVLTAARRSSAFGGQSSESLQAENAELRDQIAALRRQIKHLYDRMRVLA